MEKGLGELGFWLAVGMVIAAMIVSGALKERDKERNRQAMLRADLESKQATRQALLEKAGENMTEVLAYLREKDAEAAAKADVAWRKQKAGERQGLAFAAALVVGAFSFVGGMAALATQAPRPALPRFVISPETHQVIVQPPPPPPTGWASFAPIGSMLGIWAAGLIIAGLVWWLVGKQKNDAQPNA
jgi:hypothetical protein